MLANTMQLIPPNQQIQPFGTVANFKQKSNASLHLWFWKRQRFMDLRFGNSPDVKKKNSFSFQGNPITMFASKIRKKNIKNKK